MNTVAMGIGYIVLIGGGGYVLLVLFTLFAEQATISYAYAKGAYNAGTINKDKTQWDVFWWRMKKELPESETRIHSNGKRILTWRSWTDWEYYGQKKETFEE